MEQREDRGTGNDHLYRRKGNPKGRPHSIKTILSLMKPGGPLWRARHNQHVIMLHGPQLVLGGSSNVLVTTVMLCPPEMSLPLLTRPVGPLCLLENSWESVVCILEQILSFSSSYLNSLVICDLSETHRSRWQGYYQLLIPDITVICAPLMTKAMEVFQLVHFIRC